VNCQPDRMNDWDLLAATFDDEADHGLRDADTRAAWKALLRSALPSDAQKIADIGCGTGSLAVLLAEESRDVTGLDLSPQMLASAERKATALREHRPVFLLGDAANPSLPKAAFDAVVARHILFMLPRPEEVVARWLDLLRPGGVLVLIEGFWSTGVGLTATRCEEIVRKHRASARVQHLSTNSVLWGKDVDDDRYLIVSTE
jgi:ubiquinone/menaquinone biosynthesis C-methylase UbiE